MENKSDRLLVEDYLDKKDDEVKQASEELALKLLEFELEKKAIDDEIKQAKDEAKLIGVDVAEVARVIATIKLHLKSSPDAIKDSEMLYETFMKNANIIQSIKSVLKI